MATTAADSILVDTNVLLAASTPARAHHVEALSVLQDWPGKGHSLFCTGQILREYLVVATRPLDKNGLGLSWPDASHNLGVFTSRLKFLEENEAVSKRLGKLLNSIPCLGKQIHDANLVACALVHGVKGIVTENLQDFLRFQAVVRIIELP